MSFNIDSSSIHVFPLAKNRTEDRAARMFYEDNVANIVRQLIDTRGFIITPSKGNLQLDITNDAEYTEDSTKVKYIFKLKDVFAFNLNGYYFEMDAGSVIYELVFDKEASNNQLIADVYAYITIVDGEMSGQDYEGRYNGLHLVSSEKDIDANSTAHLNLFKVYTSIESGTRIFTVEVPEKSYIKTTADSVDIVINRIDGKRAL